MLSVFWSCSGGIFVVFATLRHDVMILKAGARTAEPLFHYSCDQLCLYEGIVIGKFFILIGCLQILKVLRSFLDKVESGGRVGRKLPIFGYDVDDVERHSRVGRGVKDRDQIRRRFGAQTQDRRKPVRRAVEQPYV